MGNSNIAIKLGLAISQKTSYERLNKPKSVQENQVCFLFVHHVTLEASISMHSNLLSKL